MKKFLILILCSAASLACAASSPAITPTVGPHAVGVRFVQQVDHGRDMEIQLNAFGKVVSGGQGRPLQTLVWYPASRTGKAPMLLADYFQAGMASVNFALPAADAAAARARLLAGPGNAANRAATLAVRDAPALGGNYPVVIYAPSLAASAFENLDLCEYLASHGYVVIASRSLGARSVTMSDDMQGLEAQAADILFLANYAQSLPQADVTKIAAVGFSWGGMANVFAAARSSRIKALVSMDGSIRYFPKLWSAATYVRPEVTNVPMLYLGQGNASLEEIERRDKFGPSYLNTMTYSDVYIAAMKPMVHRHFSSVVLRSSVPEAFTDYQRDDVLEAYRTSVLYVHKFLDAYLKNDATALGFMKQSPARNGISPHTMAMEFRPKTQKVVNEADFLRAFAAGSFKDAQGLYKKMKDSAPEFTLSAFNMNLLGYELLRGKNPRGAVELFKLATYLEPKYGNAFDSEGEAWEALGETALAIEAYEKAVAVDADQPNAIARIKALRAGGKG